MAASDVPTLAETTEMRNDWGLIAIHKDRIILIPSPGRFSPSLFTHFTHRCAV
jgi:hypothetical protein